MSDIDVLADTVGKGLVDYFIHEESIAALSSLVAIAKNAEGALAEIAHGYDGDEFLDSSDAVDACRSIARAALADLVPKETA